MNRPAGKSQKTVLAPAMAMLAALALLPVGICCRTLQSGSSDLADPLAHACCSSAVHTSGNHDDGFQSPSPTPPSSGAGCCCTGDRIAVPATRAPAGEAVSLTGFTGQPIDLLLESQPGIAVGFDYDPGIRLHVMHCVWRC